MSVASGSFALMLELTLKMSLVVPQMRLMMLLATPTDARREYCIRFVFLVTHVSLRTTISVSSKDTHMRLQIANE